VFAAARPANCLLELEYALLLDFATPRHDCQVAHAFPQLGLTVTVYLVEWLLLASGVRAARIGYWLDGQEKSWQSFPPNTVRGLGLNWHPSLNFLAVARPRRSHWTLTS
jgi:hypothetical protein